MFKSYLRYKLNMGLIILLLVTIFSSLNLKAEDQIINVKDFGVTGNAYTDDTDSLRKCLEFALEKRYEVFIPAGKYVVSDTILNCSYKKRRFGLIIRGQGRRTIIKFVPQESNAVLFNLENVTFQLEDFVIEGGDVNERRGVGLRLGNKADDKSYKYSKLENVLFMYLNVGVDFEYGWINDFYSLKLIFNNTGLLIGKKGYHCNALNFYGIWAEGNKTAIEVREGKGINFLAGCVEGNNIGFEIKAGTDININNIYFEGNKSAHILAGCADKRVKSVNIIGGSWNTGDIVKFDRVNFVNIKGVANYRNSDQLIITENVKKYNLELRYPYGNSKHSHD